MVKVTCGEGEGRNDFGELRRRGRGQGQKILGMPLLLSLIFVTWFDLECAVIRPALLLLFYL